MIQKFQNYLRYQTSHLYHLYQMIQKFQNYHLYQMIHLHHLYLMIQKFQNYLRYQTSHLYHLYQMIQKFQNYHLYLTTQYRKYLKTQMILMTHLIQLVRLMLYLILNLKYFQNHQSKGLVCHVQPEPIYHMLTKHYCPLNYNSFHIYKILVSQPPIN
jgi:hypothetical protein